MDGAVAAEMTREGGEGWRERRFGRCRIFKPAQIGFDGTVVDCVLLDISPHGAQIHLKRPGLVPDIVTLRLPSGEDRTVRRCWQKGAHIGFEVVGNTPLVV